MLAIAKLAPGQEAYYEASVAAGLEDYYAGRGESAGVWAGTGSALLGLVGVVAEGELSKIVNGIDPVTDRELRKHRAARIITITRPNPLTGEPETVAQRLAPVAGFDLVFSTPKSISLLHALGNDDVRLAVVQAHEASWQAALAYLEAEACVTRRGAGGVISEPGAGFVAAAFQHRTSRAQDPHLHTHLILANMTRSPDGTYRALDGRCLLEQHRLAAGYLYQAQLRAELTRSLGVSWQEPVKGMAEIVGIPRAVLVEFSQRRRQVIERVAEMASDGYHAASLAAHETRAPKTHVDLAELRKDWWARASEHGLTASVLTAALGRTRFLDQTPSEVTMIARTLLGAQGLTEKQTTFTSTDAIIAWANTARRGSDASTITALVDELLQQPSVEVLGERGQGRLGRYSTQELLAVERSALAIVERGRTATAPAASLEAIIRATSASPVRLSSEQQTYVRVAASSRERVVCVVGVAGAGKTTATRTLATGLTSAGIPVLGVAPSGNAAEKLADETGLRSTTIHRLLVDADHGLPHGVVVVIDEAGMADSRTLERLLTLVETADGKAILVGDPAQLPSVGAGGLFPAIIDRVGAIELTDNRRQHDVAERHALTAIRNGHGHDYLAWAADAGRLVTSDDPISVRSRLLTDWWQHARHDPRENIMIALRRRDVAELNTLARTLRDTAGQLGPERLVAARQEYAIGDRIVCLRNNTILDVRNGTRGTITAIDASRRAILVATDRGDQVTLTHRYLDAGHVNHAYALTAHASQGATVDRAYVLAPQRGALQEWGYVALTRARHETKTYVAQHQLELDGASPTIRDDQRLGIERLATALRASGVEQPAIEWDA